MELYNVLNKLGAGSYGQVFLAEKKESKVQYVIKEIKVSQFNYEDLEEAKKEVKVLSSLVHNYITKFYDSFEGCGSLYIVMEYCAGGDLQKLIDSRNNIYFPEERIFDWFVQLCLAVNFIHQRYIIHRDIKTQNIFLTDEGKIKLGDFGIAKILDKTSDLANTCIGTPYYLSPEMCENKPYSNKSDVWAIGCVLYEMASLKHAFNAKNMKSLVIKIIRCSYLPLPPRYSRNMKLLIQQIFQRDPKARPSVSSILSKPFIAKKLPRFLTAEDAEELKSFRITKMKPTTSSSKRKALRSRIGITDPGAKYGISPKINVSYPIVTSINRNGNHVSNKTSKSSNSVSRDKKSYLYESPVSCHQWKKSHKDKFIHNEKKSKPSQRVSKSVSYLENSKDYNNKKVAKNTCSGIEDPLKLNLIMKESKSSFKKIDVSDSIMCNLESSLRGSDMHNNSGWLVDMYLSRKLITLKNDLRSSHFFMNNDLSESIHNKVNFVVKNEIKNVSQMASNRRQSAYYDERDAYDYCRQVQSPIQNQTNFPMEEIFMSIKGETTVSSLDFDCKLKNTPVVRRMKWQPAHTPVFAKYSLETRDSVSDELIEPQELDNRNRKQWSSGPQDIVNILSSIKLADGRDSITFEGRKSVLRNSTRITQPTSNEQYPLANNQGLKKEDASDLDTLSLLPCFCIGKEQQSVEVQSETKDNETEKSDANLVTVVENNVSDPVPCGDMGKCVIPVADSMSNPQSESDAIHSNTTTSNEEDDSKCEDTPTPNSKKAKRKFFSFLQSKPSQCKESKSQSSVKDLNNTNSTPRSKARFSAILKKFLQRESQSHSPSRKSSKTNARCFSSTTSVLPDADATINDDNSINDDSVFVSKLEVTLGHDQGTEILNTNLSLTADSGLETQETNSASINSNPKVNDLNATQSCTLTDRSEKSVIENVKYMSGLEIEINNGINDKEKPPIDNKADVNSRENGFDLSLAQSNNNTITENGPFSVKDLPSKTESNFCNNNLSAIRPYVNSTMTVPLNLNKFEDAFVNLRQNVSDVKFKDDDVVKTAFDLVQDVFKIALKELENQSFATKRVSGHNLSHERLVSSDENTIEQVTESKSLISKHDFTSNLTTDNDMSTPVNKYSNCKFYKMDHQASPIAAWDETDNFQNSLEFDRVVTQTRSCPVKIKRHDANPCDNNFPNDILFVKNCELKENNIPSGVRLSEEDEAEDVKNFRKSLEDLLSCSADESDFEPEFIHRSVSAVNIPDTPDGDIHGWIEEQKANFETRLGLTKFLKVYRCLEGAFEQNDSDLKSAMTRAKLIIGPSEGELAHEIFQLILTESVHLH